MTITVKQLSKIFDNVNSGKTACYYVETYGGQGWKVSDIVPTFIEADSLKQYYKNAGVPARIIEK